MQVKQKLLITAIGLGLLSSVSISHAANWLALQGTEPEGQSQRARVWGFIQPEYQTTKGTKLPVGPSKGKNSAFNTIGPNFKSDSTFNIRRARIGVRGTGFPLDTKVNYFFLAEFGNNGITRPGGGGGSAKVTDASITLNYVEGARIRVGQFKTPGAEEGLQAIHVFDYVNFTGITDGVLLERYFDNDGSAANTKNTPNGPVGAFRDIGIQVFDTFKVGNWEHSYAVMYGNGNGITRADNDDNKDTYLYWSSELVFAGKGARRQGLKLFAWNQSGKRTLIGAGKGEYDRDRRGLGATFRKDKYRAAFEFIDADGMIRNGTDGAGVPGSTANNGDVVSVNIETQGEADGWYAHFGYAVIPKLELDIRYDIFNRMTNNAKKERTFEAVTLGAQYFFNKKTRATFNYEIRDAKAPNLPGSAGPNIIADSRDDRMSVQLITIF